MMLICLSTKGAVFVPNIKINHLDPRIIYLLNHYLRKEASKQELEELYNWLQEPKNEAQFPGLLEEVWNNFEEKEPMREGRAAAILNQIIAQPSSGTGRVFRLKWLRVAAAAIVILLAGVTVMVVVNRNKNKAISHELSQNDIAPGGNRAVLTLTNGTKIILDSAHFGKLAQQGTASITKTDSGKLSYSLSPSEENTQKPDEPIAYNTLATPRGGQYQIILPDGSQAWLNAASSIKYPVAFKGNERRVEITGEVYFEVAKDASRPFKVTVSPSSVGIGSGTEIEVLGTHFNVNAYDDESDMKTTLLEGRIRLSAANHQKSIILNPGNQARLDGQGKMELLKEADVEQVMAWKNGLFNFDGADLNTVLRQLGRWYDIEVQYAGPVPKRQFRGELHRNLNLSQVIKILEKMKVNFSIEGRRLIVEP